MEAHLANLQYSLHLGEEAVETQQRSVALSEELSQSLQNLRQAVPLMDAISDILDMFAAVFDRHVQIEFALLLFITLVSCIVWLSPGAKLYALYLMLLYGKWPFVYKLERY